MPNEELLKNPAYIQASEEIPPKWYEPEKKVDLTSFGVLMGGTLAGALEIKFGIDIREQLLMQSSGCAAIATASCFADNKSTISAMRACTEAAEKGIPTEFDERNPFLGKTAEEVKKNHWRVDAMVIATSILWPLGLSIASAKFIAALNNYRYAKRVRRAVEIADSPS